MAILENAVKDILSKAMQENYPQTQFPAVVKARITKAREIELKQELHLYIKNQYGQEQEVNASVKWFEYSLRILSKDGEGDNQYPIIPGVRSACQAEIGDIVAVALLYGELSPYILGEVH